MPSPGLGVLSPQQLGFGGLALYRFLGPVAVTSLVLFVAALIVIAYRLVLHPLACVPGPKIAALSNIWYAYHARNGRMLELGKTLHRRYGPMVRVGPNEVWFDSVDAFKHIYISTALQRPDITFTPFPTFTSPETLDLLSERNTARYRLQRRLIGPLYQTNHLKRYEPALDAVLARVISTLRALDGKEIDLKEWMHIIAVECLSALVISWSPRDGTDHKASSHGYQGWRRKSVFGLFPLAVKAELFSKAFGRAFANLWRVTYRTPKNFKPFFTGVYRQVSRRITNSLSGKPVPKNDRKDDFLTDLIQLHKDKPDFSEQYLRRMAITNFGAGHETMCSALTSIMSMRHPKSYDNAVRLAYTQAAIKEAQRLYPVLGMSLPRTVPPEGFTAHGQFFPGGTTVGCNPVSLHRNTSIFGPDAEDYNPDRWLDEERDVRGLMEHFDVEVTMPPEEEIEYYFMAMLTGVGARFLPKKTG
uniref:Cytochrome p450 71d7 n=1 Tax=Colletotrichum fructicola (strain Nara gc5) TaxID=1213859 RepID=L2GBV3_COLFN